MPQNNYGTDPKIKTFAEHLLPPIVTYIVRKFVLALVLVNIRIAEDLSRIYGFHMAAEVADRDEWRYDLRDYLPDYRAKIEKVS